MPLQLIVPTSRELPLYKEALDKGWSPDNQSTERRRVEELAKIAEDPAGFLNSFDDSEGNGEVTLPDGSKVPRLPSVGRWMWDGEFCGHIGLRWKKGTTDLPPTCLGHIGYSVVPWKQKRGYATAALKLILKEARTRLAFVDITTDIDNFASQKVILANDGMLIEKFKKPPSMDEIEALRFRIILNPSP